jgi:hypothetical protein
MQQHYLVLAHEVLDVETRRETACTENGVFFKGQATIGHHARHGRQLHRLNFWRCACRYATREMGDARLATSAQAARWQHPRKHHGEMGAVVATGYCIPPRQTNKK